ncbi:MAG: SRPBCC family protein [Bdellovibrionia bacterium]
MMKASKVTHGTFTIDRTYKASAEAVFSAWSNLESRAQWFVGPTDWTPIRRELEFRVGGKEVLHGRFANGYEPLYESRFHSIVGNERIVFVYDMYLNGEHHSVSLASVEIESLEPGKTRLIFTEQVAFMDGTDGQDGTKDRKEGTQELLKLLAVFLER